MDRSERPAPLTRPKKTAETRRLAPAMRVLQALHSAGAPEAMTPAELEKQRRGQELLGNLAADMTDMVWEEFSIGAMPAAWMRLRRPHRRRRAVLYCHGGGYTSGNLGYSKVLASKLTKATGYDVLTFEYRLAPEHPYPAAVEDGLRAWDHLMYLGYGARDVVVAGDSAGGNLAAALCLMAREQRLPMPCAQMLLYPVLDARMETESYRQFTDTPMCSSRDMEKYFAMYAPGPSAAPREWLSPAESASLQGLPSAYIETAEFDCLRDEGAQYAAHLAREGVPCEYHPIKNAMHGYDIAVNSEFLRPVMAYRIEFLRKVFTGK